MTMPFDSHTSPEVAIARIEERLTSLTTQVVELRAEEKVAHSELASSMKALEARERERNGQIRDLAEYRRANEQQMQEHLLWANELAVDVNKIGESLAAFSEALAAIQAERHDSKVRASVWKSQIKFILGGGGAGSLITAIAAGLLWFFRVL